MGAYHTDLISWSSKSRSKGNTTIELDNDTAEKIGLLLMNNAQEIDRLNRIIFLASEALKGKLDI